MKDTFLVGTINEAILALSSAPLGGAPLLVSDAHITSLVQCAIVAV